MIAKHGSAQAVTEFMANSAKKAEHAGEGGFKHMAKHNPDKLREVSKRGGSIGRRTK